MPPDGHPIIAQLVADCEQRGAAVYAGETFLMATWPSGDRLEARVDWQPPAIIPDEPPKQDSR